jgi:hypothetical protein
MLGILQRQGNGIVALLANCRFLVLEPNSARSNHARQQVLGIVHGNVKSDPTKNQTNITLNINTPKDEGDFGTVQLMLSLLVASKMAKAEVKDPLPGTFESLFKMMSEVSEDKRTGFGWKYYAPYFIEIQKRGFVPSFLDHILQDKPSRDDKMAEFLNWSEAFDWSGWPPNRSLKPTEWAEREIHGQGIFGKTNEKRGSRE